MIRSFQWDLARQVERLDWLIAQLPRYAEWGYHEVHLHLEDAVEYPSLPAVGRRDAYTYRQLGQLVDAATRVGIKVVPIVNLLGHTQYLIKVPQLRDLNELRAADGSPLERGQICPLHPRTLEVAEKLLRDMAPFCTAGKVHVGLDESFQLGKHPLSQREIARIGLAAHFAGYVKRLYDVVDSLGLKMGMWADMLYFVPDAIPLLPKGITAYEWYYYSFRRMPRVELFNSAEVDISTPLRQQGLRLYGCPMNGAFRHEPLPTFTDRMNNILAWWRHTGRVGAEGFLVSSWEPYRLALELTTAVDAAAATLWLEPKIREPREMLARGFERLFGKRGRAAADIALACDRYPFAGYPRWEINQRWDTCSPRESLQPFRQEMFFFTNLARVATRRRLPVSLRASVQFRQYLAERDLSVRILAREQGASKPRRALIKNTSAKLLAATTSGLRAARTMWRRTRDPRNRGQNEMMVLADRNRLRAWRHDEPAFGGQWKLCYAVWNFAPAAQLVGIEQQQNDGTWTTLQSCHTIEFQAIAARPRGRMIREHASPVVWDGDPTRMPRLRLFVGGVGEVKFGRVALVGGERTYRWKSRSGRWLRLGFPAPPAGWPVMRTEANRDAVELHFERR